MPVGIELDSGRIAKSRWDDLSVSASSTKIGSNLRPDFDYVNLGLLFPQNDTSEKVYLTFQMSHKKKLDTAIRLHIHFIQSSSVIPVFGCIYRYYNNGSTEPSFSAEIETTGILPFTWESGRLLNIIKFPEIQALENEALSANLDVILYRKDNVVTGDVLVKYIDLHYEIDTDGSFGEYIK